MGRRYFLIIILVSYFIFGKVAVQFDFIIVYDDPGVAEIILRTQTKPNLKCMSAKIVQKYSIPYDGMVPKHLESFIRLHGIGEWTRQIGDLIC